MQEGRDGISNLENEWIRLLTEFKNTYDAGTTFRVITEITAMVVDSQNRNNANQFSIIDFNTGQKVTYLGGDAVVEDQNFDPAFSAEIVDKQGVVNIVKVIISPSSLGSLVQE